MKEIPIELTDMIIYVATALLGWLTRWLQDRGTKKEYKSILSEQQQIINDQQITMKGLKGTIDNQRNQNKTTT